MDLRSLPGTSTRILAAVATMAAFGCGSEGANGPSDSIDVLTPGVAAGWFGGTTAAYEIGVTASHTHGGQKAAYIKALGQSTSAGVMSQFLNATSYRGKRLRLSAWVRHTNLTGSSVGLWMRVDGPGLATAFDNMDQRPLSGSSDWHLVSVVLDVTPNAQGIALGALMTGAGTLVFDDMKLEVVGADVPSTNILTAPLASGDSATNASTYGRSSATPVNPDFEGVPAITTQSSDWLRQFSAALTTTDPQAPLADLAPLKQMIGPATLVGLGEGTHGTSDFFKMKHRVLEMLVTQMGFTVFAIEATTPESDDLNRYVLSGVGDPKVLLSRLYFWTWNTQEVLDMVTWMRQWNASASPAQQVQFRGFDMQNPGASMDSVLAFVTRVDAGNGPFVQQRLACIAPYRNRGQTLGASTTAYAALPFTDRTACANALGDVYALMNGHAAEYQAASSGTEYQLRLHDARLIQQFEAMASVSSNATAGSRARDKAMAENIVWLRTVSAPQAKIALWAHNGHINRVDGLMGGYLGSMYGADYVNLGFVFGHGSFNAVGGGTGTLGPQQANLVVDHSIEQAFVGTGQPRLLFDTRTLVVGGAAADVLRGPIGMRSIGAVFSPNSEALYTAPSFFPNDFDLLIYLESTSASKLLPFVYQ
ncbi:MAG: erythromycin esterase family protein [bacterium]